MALALDVQMAIDVIRYYAGWADKLTGQTIEVNSHFLDDEYLESYIVQTNPAFLTYTTHEPYGVVGQIIPCEYDMKTAESLLI